MRAECSDQRRMSATVSYVAGSNASPTGRPVPSARPPGRAPLGVALTLVFLATLALGLAGNLACGSSWTGSVGAVLGKGKTDGRLFIREAPAGMGAAKAGVLPGDEVLAIDGLQVANLSPEAVHKALSGKVGSKVKLTLARAKVTLEVTIERGPLQGS